MPKSFPFVLTAQPFQRGGFLFSNRCLSGKFSQLWRASYGMMLTGGQKVSIIKKLIRQHLYFRMANSEEKRKGQIFMRNIRIVADSSANILTRNGVAFATAPLKIITAEREFVDDSDLEDGEIVAGEQDFEG